MAVTLTIYTMTHCPTCAETGRIAAEIRARYRGSIGETENSVR